MTSVMPQLPCTVKEVAEHYGMSEGAVRQEIASGRLKAAHKRGQRKVWYMKPEWIQEWAETMLEDI